MDELHPGKGKRDATEKCPSYPLETNSLNFENAEAKETKLAMLSGYEELYNCLSPLSIIVQEHQLKDMLLASFMCLMEAHGSPHSFSWVKWES